jgi:UDP-GlcNAc:undecaprenyl-phosphate GlcNAc-1-phosphate transferase
MNPVVSVSVFSSILPLLVAVLSYLLCSLLIPVVIRIATARGWLDLPGDRRVHLTPVPRLGGVAVFFATGLAMLLIALVGWVTAGTFPRLAVLPGFVPGLLLGVASIFLIGVSDDLTQVSPTAKLFVQVIAAVIVLSSGFHPTKVAVAPGLPTWEIVGLPAAAITLLWIVGVTNAFNLIDGIDGLAGTMALIAIGTSLMASLLAGNPGASMVLLVVAGAVIAFLRANWAPARLFLGDSGSMTLGFLLSILSVEAGTSADGVAYPLVPLVALAYPVLDTFTAMARRWVRGHPFSRADGRHIHHQLRRLGLSAPRAVQVLALLFSAVSAIGLAIVFAPARLTAALALASSVALFALVVYGFRWLGYQEFSELGASVVSVLRHARVVVNEKVTATEVAGLIPSATSLDEVRTLLNRLVDETRVLDIELISMEESSRRYGPPSQQISPADALPVRLDYPLALAGRPGHAELVLRVWAVRPNGAHHPAAERLVGRVGPVLDQWVLQRGDLNPTLGLPRADER